MKTKENLKTTFDKRIVQNAMLNAVGSEYGDEAAQFVKNSNVKVTDARGGMDE